METTTNIPSRVPLECSDDYKVQLLDWIKTQPAHPSDECSDRLERWEWMALDNGLDTLAQVNDSATGEKFMAEPDIDNW